MKKELLKDYARLLKLENVELRKLGPVNLTLEKQKKYWLKAFRKEQYMANSLSDAMMCRIEEISKDGSPEQQASIVQLKGVVESAEKTVHRQHAELEELKAETARRKNDCNDLRDEVETKNNEINELTEKIAEMEKDTILKHEEFTQIVEDFKVKNVKLENDLFRTEGKLKTLEENKGNGDDLIVLKVELSGLKAKNKQLEDETKDLKHDSYEKEKKLKMLQAENSDLLKKVGDLQVKKDEPELSKSVIQDIDDLKANPEEEKTEEAAPAGSTKKEITLSNGLVDAKNRLCNKNYKVEQNEKGFIAIKPGTRKIEVTNGPLPGSAMFTVCSGKFYDLDSALRASAHGVKSVRPTDETVAV